MKNFATKYRGLLSIIIPTTMILLLIILSYGNIIFFHQSLNPVLLIPPSDISLSTGYADISGTDSVKNGWRVDLANPAYLEWPVNIFIGKALRAGHIPIVLPYQSLGIPLIGQYCYRVLSPYQILENLFFPRGYDAFILLRLVLSALFTYFFIRPLCRRRVSALLAAVGYGLGSVMVIYSNHEEVTNVAMFLPLLIWSVRAFFDRPGIGRGAGLALTLALVHTAGQPEIQLYVLLLAFLYGLTRFFSLPAGKKKTAFFYGAGAVLLSVIIAGPQIYPFLRFHQEAWTYHPPGGNLGIQSPMRAGNFLFAFFPKAGQALRPWSYRTTNLIWDWVGGYFGLGLLLLAAAGARRPPRRLRREIFLFGGYFFFILSKNLGWSPTQMIGLLPFFDQAWTPRWAAATWSFSLAVLAAFGLDHILDPSSRDDSSPAAALPARRPARWSLFLPLLGVIIVLAIIFRYQSRISWEESDLHLYIFFSGTFFLLLAAGAALIYYLFSRRERNYPAVLRQRLRSAPAKRQFILLALCAAGLTAGLRWLPLKYYVFSHPEAAGAYLFAAPLLLVSLFGLFYIAASPSGPGMVAASALVIPLVLLGIWNKPAGLFQVIGWAFFALSAASLFLREPRSTFVRRLLLLPPFLLLVCLILPEILTVIYSEIQSAHFPYLQTALTVIIIAAFSGMNLRASRGETPGNGWFFLILTWAELTIYLPKNHSQRFWGADSIPFLAAALIMLICFLHSRRAELSPRAKIAYPLAAFILSALVLVTVDGISPGRLPAQDTHRQSLPFIKYLRGKGPIALTGVGRVLSPNFASAHDLTDLRGCDSMNTLSYQFFLSNILRVVPPASSFSLWYTGDNSTRRGGGNPYASSINDHLLSLKFALPFYSLAGIRYVISPPGALDTLASFQGKQARKVYQGKADVWELPSLPSAYLTHKATVVSMISETMRWARAVAVDGDVLKGRRVLLEDAPAVPLPESPPGADDRAELITGENPNLLRVRFHSEKPAYLVVNRAYTNLLRAYLDGKELPVLRANGPFLAVPVPGSQQDRVLDLTYLSPPTRLSFFFSILGLLTAGAGLVVAGVRRKSRKIE